MLPSGVPGGGQISKIALADAKVWVWIPENGVVYVSEKGGAPVKLRLISAQAPPQTVVLLLADILTVGNVRQVTGMALEKLRHGSAKLILPFRLSPAPATT